MKVYHGSDFRLQMSRNLNLFHITGHVRVTIQKTDGTRLLQTGPVRIIS